MPKRHRLQLMGNIDPVLAEIQIANDEWEHVGLYENPHKFKNLGVSRHTSKTSNRQINIYLKSVNRVSVTQEGTGKHPGPAAAENTLPPGLKGPSVATGEAGELLLKHGYGRRG